MMKIRIELIDKQVLFLWMLTDMKFDNEKSICNPKD